MACNNVYEVQTCWRCDAPIRASHNLAGSVPTRPCHGLVVKIGHSSGGWGQRTDLINYSKEVCDECFNEIRSLLEPVIEHIRNPPKQRARGDNVQPLRRDQLEPERRRTPLLRALQSICSK